MNHVKSLLALMPFQTSGQRYNSRTIRQGREELELVLDGQAGYLVNGRYLTIRAGNLIWHHSGDQTIFSNARGDDYECLVLAFEVEPNIASARPRISDWNSMISPRQFCEDALNYLYNHPKPGLDFCRYLYSSCCVHTTPESHAQDLNERVLQKARAFIASNYSSNITIETIARKAHVSPSHLHGLFRDRLHMTPYEALSQYRMERALKLLLRGTPIKQVVDACGFGSESGFIRAFKKRYGVPPGAYRKELAAIGN